MNKLNPNILFSVYEIGLEIAKAGMLSEDIFSASIQHSLTSREYDVDDMPYYIRAVWKMLQAFPTSEIYNRDYMRSAIEYIAMKMNTGENLKTTRIKFAKQYGEQYLFYLEVANEGANTFPRSYAVKTTTRKKRTVKKKPTAKPAASKLPKIKWNEEISMGTIDTDALPGAKISLCRRGDEKFIVLESDTARFGIPIQSAQSIAVTLENSIEQAKKLEWL